MRGPVTQPSLDTLLETLDLSTLRACYVEILRLRQQTSSLLEGTSLVRGVNILAFGNPGNGETHLRSLFVHDFLAAERDLTFSRDQKHLALCQVLLIDNIGYVK